MIIRNGYSEMRSFMAKHCKEIPKVEDLKKEAEVLADAKKKEEQRLLDLYTNKKLTNKNTIRKARIIAAEYAKANKEN